MQHIKTVEVPAATKEVVDFITCDLCGKRITTEGFEVDEVNVEHRTGENYPEGGSGEQVEFDLCGKCFDEKLTPWLRTQGAEPRETEWDW